MTPTKYLYGLRWGDGWSPGGTYLKDPVEFKDAKLWRQINHVRSHITLIASQSKWQSIPNMFRELPLKIVKFKVELVEEETVDV